MRDYVYIARDQDGHEVRGEVSAPNVAEGVMILESRGLNVQSITSVTDEERGQQKDSGGVTVPAAYSGPSSIDRHLQAVIDRRETILPPLKAFVQELPPGRARREIKGLLREVDAAHNIEDFRRSETVVRWLPLLASGFSSDSTTRRLSDLIAYTTRDLQNRMERRRLMAYPILVMLICAVVLGLLCALVVPTFDKMFGDFGIQLPWATLVLVEVTRQFQLHLPATLIKLAVGAGLIYTAVRIWIHFALTTRLFGFTVSGNSASLSAMSSLTGQLAELLQIGVSVPDALWISGRGCDHFYFKKASERLARDAHVQTRPLGQSSVAHVFPANMIDALDAGEDGPNIPLLRELSSMYAMRVQRRVDWSTGAMTQLSIVFLGGAIAFLVIALFMPLFSLISALS